MARYFAGHVAVSAGIALGGIAAGYLLEAAAGRGTVQYLNDVVRAASTFLAYSGPAVGAGYFLGMLPSTLDAERRLRRQRRTEDIEDIGLDTAELRARRRRASALGRFLDSL